MQQTLHQPFAPLAKEVKLETCYSVLPARHAVECPVGELCVFLTWLQQEE